LNAAANIRFEVAFPFATEKEKDAEKAHIEKNFHVVQDANVKGHWVTSDVALQLAKEYGLEEYIRAMKDASPDKPSDMLTLPTTTGKGKASSVPSSTPKLPHEAPRRSRRSVSPKKSAQKPAAPKAPSSTTGRGRKKRGSTVDDESVASSSPKVPHSAVFKTEEAIDKIVEEDKPLLDSIRVVVCSCCGVYGN
jgi:hypothetical protein